MKKLFSKYLYKEKKVTVGQCSSPMNRVWRNVLKRACHMCQTRKKTRCRQRINEFLPAQFFIRLNNTFSKNGKMSKCPQFHLLLQDGSQTALLVG